jgi:hypothetical protein
MARPVWLPLCDGAMNARLVLDAAQHPPRESRPMFAETFSFLLIALRRRPLRARWGGACPGSGS